jgi:hypothetical protein
MFGAIDSEQKFILVVDQAYEWNLNSAWWIIMLIAGLQGLYLLPRVVHKVTINVLLYRCLH